jgi:hypothetical protein
MAIPGRFPDHLAQLSHEGPVMRTKLLAAAAVLAASALTVRSDEGLTKGNPDVKSVSALAFGPNGVLFVGDPQGAAIFAIDTGDKSPGGTQPLNLERVDAKLAGVLGAQDKDIAVNDLKVNPASGNVYLAVTRGKSGGAPAIVRVTRSGEVQPVALKDVPFAKVAIPNPAPPTAKGGATTVITSMAFVDGKLIVAGLSNEEFASTLRTIPYPFKEADKGAGVQIFHGNHGRLETNAPIRTFTPYKVGSEPTILAGYTCTPLVKIPVSELKAGAKVKGTTIAELGNMNTPLDMIPYTKDGKNYVLIANDRRGVMKLEADAIPTAEPITARVPGTAGPKYETIAELKGVLQMDKLDDARVVLLVRTDTGLDIKTIPLP